MIQEPRTKDQLTYLLDVDNTLLDNDAVIEDLRKHLVSAFGAECEQRYWEIFEELRRELGYADYLGALQRYRVERPREPHLLQISLYLLHYPFAERVYPRAFDVIRRLRESGAVAILTDGDVVFQPPVNPEPDRGAAAEHHHPDGRGLYFHPGGFDSDRHHRCGQAVLALR